MANPSLIGTINTAANMVMDVLASVQLASGDNAVYTAAASSAVKVETASLCNITGSPVTVSVSVVPSGGTLDGTHKVIASYTLTPYNTISHEDGLAALKGLMLGPGDFISVNAGTGSAVDCVLTGTVVS